jgi:hypothetical protein
VVSVCVVRQEPLASRLSERVSAVAGISAVSAGSPSGIDWVAVVV